MSVIQSAYPTLARQATTGIGGFALQNATPTILSWTAPNDGRMHRVIVMTSVYTSSAETGGGVTATFTLPDGLHPATITLQNAGLAGGVHPGTGQLILIAPGSAITVQQSTALTAGAATLWAEIWGS